MSKIHISHDAVAGTLNFSGKSFTKKTLIELAREPKSPLTKALIQRAIEKSIVPLEEFRKNNPALNEAMLKAWSQDFEVSQYLKVEMPEAEKKPMGRPKGFKVTPKRILVPSAYSEIADRFTSAGGTVTVDTWTLNITTGTIWCGDKSHFIADVDELRVLAHLMRNKYVTIENKDICTEARLSNNGGTSARRFVTQKVTNLQKILADMSGKSDIIEEVGAIGYRFNG